MPPRRAARKADRVKAHDSDALDQTLAEGYGIEMIAANCVNGGKVQDGRSLWRYKRFVALLKCLLRWPGSILTNGKRLAP